MNTSTPTLDLNADAASFVTFAPKAPPPPPQTLPKPVILTHKPNLNNETVHKIETIHKPLIHHQQTTTLYKPTNVEPLNLIHDDDDDDIDDIDDDLSGYGENVGAGSRVPITKLLNNNQNAHVASNRYVKEQEERFIQKEVTTQEIKERLYERRNLFLSSNPSHNIKIINNLKEPSVSFLQIFACCSNH